MERDLLRFSLWNFGTGGRWEDVKSPPEDRLLLLVLFLFLTWKSSKGSAYDCSCCPHLLGLPLPPRMLKCPIVWQWCQRQRGESWPKDCWDSCSMTDQVQRFPVIVRFVQLNCVCCYILWTYHHKCFLSLCLLCKVLILWQMHKGQLLQIIPLMYTMIINLANASLAINIFKELNLHSVSRNYVCPASMFCFLQVWTALCTVL